MEIKGFAGVLHEPVIIVTKVKVWKKHFFMELFVSGRETGYVLIPIEN